MTPIVSIIIPIYQSEGTISRCLHSIQCQTFKDFELILVDDGSTDRSVAICEKFAKEDSRIRLFSKIHSGVADTRQMGLENAQGKYILHCDSDDWMELNMLEAMVCEAQKTNSDLIVCDYIVESDSGSAEKREVTSFAKKFKCSQLSYYLWNKMIKRSFLQNNNIFFPKGVELAEDMYVILMILNHNANISYVPYALYHYNQLSQRISITNNITRSRWNTSIEIINKLESLLDKRLKKRLNSNKVQAIISAYRYSLLSNNELRRLFPEVHFSILLSSIKNWKLLQLVSVLYL